MPSFSKHARTMIACCALGLSLAAPAASQDAKPDSDSAAKQAAAQKAAIDNMLARFAQGSELRDVAIGLIKVAPAPAALWPGFWPSGQPFIVVSPRGEKVVVSGERFEGSMSQERLRENLWLHEFSSNDPDQVNMSYSLVREIDGQLFFELAAAGRSLEKRVNFYLHESFHGYQNIDETWDSSDDEKYASKAKFGDGNFGKLDLLKDTSFLDDENYQHLVREEEAILNELAQVKSEIAARALLNSYFAHRERRLAGKEPMVEEIEDHFARKEGSATYVGCTTVFLAGMSKDNIHQCGNSAHSDGDRFADPNYLMRWRHYGAGATLARTANILGIPRWRERIASGEYLDDILREAIST